jgi:hypothetical protein
LINGPFVRTKARRTEISTCGDASGPGFGSTFVADGNHDEFEKLKNILKDLLVKESDPLNSMGGLQLP